MKNKLLNIIFTIVIISGIILGQNVQSPKEYFFYPKSYKKWDYNFVTGLSITKLPIEIAEEEINTSPMLHVGFKLGLPLNLTTDIQFSANYMANIGTLGLHWAIINNQLSLSVGGRSSVWFGHLEMGPYRVKSFGVILAPCITAGMDFGDFIVSASAEIQYSYMKTASEDELLGEFYYPHGGYAFKFWIEQPLWNDQWVVIGISLNYAKYFYQSWLSYSTIDEYLLYPEFSFGFIL